MLNEETTYTQASSIQSIKYIIKKTTKYFKNIKIFFLNNKNFFNKENTKKNIFSLCCCFFLGGCLSNPKKKPSLSSYCRTFRPYKIKNHTYYPLKTYNYCGRGVASYYHNRFNGQRTSSGEVFDNNKLTAAHKTLPMHSLVRITNMDNGRSIIVRINDRGPFSKKRLIDVSAATAKALGFLQKGVTRVSLEVLKKESKAEGVKHGLRFPKT